MKELIKNLLEKKKEELKQILSQYNKSIDDDDTRNGYLLCGKITELVKIISELEELLRWVKEYER